MLLKPKGTSIRPKTQSAGSAGIFQTKPEVLRPLLDYIPKRAVIWEPMAGEGWLVDAMRERGYTVIASDVLGFRGKRPRDFLTWEPSARWDVVLTNPDYSGRNKEAFLERAYTLGKPFAFLLPLTTLEGKSRQTLFRENGVQLILFPWRAVFETPNGKVGGGWFPTAWFTWGLGLKKDLTFWSELNGQLRTTMRDDRTRTRCSRR